jgi:hypothetical protein
VRNIFGSFPAYHLLPVSAEVLSATAAFNLRIRDAWLKRQNYDKWFDRFIRKFDPEEEMSATMAFYRGQQDDHGWEVYCTQGSRQCCLLDTTYGLTDEESLRTDLSA